MTDDFDQIWKALSDPTRRAILDLLRKGSKKTTEIVEAFPDMTRFAVMKHIEVLRSAGLINTREEGRQRINSLNVAPIRQIYERWVGPFAELWSSTLLRLKDDVEKKTDKELSVMQVETKQMRLVDLILAEIDQEAAITKRLFDIIPEDKLNWRPHPKAKSLGELAMHIAGLQAGVAELTQEDTVELPNFPPNPEATSRAQILETFAASLKRAKDIVGSTDDAGAMAEYKITKDGKTLMAIPRIGFWRAILLNHNYHHRGQLSTYLRELGIPLPSIYGPSADSNPFA